MTLHAKLMSLKTGLKKTIVGQDKLIDRLLLALLADGHLLVEGAPGLAKTKSIKALSELIEGDFHRIQFTPDLLPADITGTDVYHPETGQFAFQAGPVFHNLILADEINRAAAKVQSALLEAMGEHQVSIGNKTHKLPDLFLVMATQNPIEQEGTFSLPEAQLDRFMMHVRIGFPDAETEKNILHLNRQESRGAGGNTVNKQHVISQEEIFSIRQAVSEIHMDEAVLEYLVQIVMATRHPEKISENMAGLIEYGASPRATIYLDRCSRAFAWMQGKDFVSPSDILEVVYEVLRHRIGLTFEADSLGFDTDRVISEILETVVIP